VINVVHGPRRPGISASRTLSRSPDVDRLMSDVESAMGPIDILTNSAGINIRGRRINCRSRLGHRH
jgi:NAD(P)-dependent dehydrogenase (short-subunit alcohol dehydrogenase family)